MINKVTTAEARKHFADIVNNVAYGKDTIVLTRRGKELAALVSIDDLKLLQELEDRQDIEDAWKIKNEPDENIKLSDLKKELDLSIFNHRYKNSKTGATAYDPKVLLKIVIHNLTLLPLQILLVSYRQRLKRFSGMSFLSAMIWDLSEDRCLPLMGAKYLLMLLKSGVELENSSKTKSRRWNS